MNSLIEDYISIDTVDLINEYGWIISQKSLPKQSYASNSLVHQAVKKEMHNNGKIFDLQDLNLVILELGGPCKASLKQLYQSHITKTLTSNVQNVKAKDHITPSTINMIEFKQK